MLTVFMIKQVMHGADKDVLWLQRDFGIYICNLFDTGQVCIKSSDNSILIDIISHITVETKSYSSCK